MDQRYPTRENMQRSSDYYADYGELKPRYVAWMLAMYDEIDRLKAKECSECARRKREEDETYRLMFD